MSKNTLSIPESVACRIVGFISIAHSLKKASLINRAFEKAVALQRWATMTTTLRALKIQDNSSLYTRGIHFILPTSVPVLQAPNITRLRLKMWHHLEQDFEYSIDAILDLCTSLEHLELDLPLSLMSNRTDILIPSVALNGFHGSKEWLTDIPRQTFVDLICNYRSMTLTLADITSGFDRLVEDSELGYRSLNIASLSIYRCLFTQIDGLVVLLNAIRGLTSFHLTYEQNYNGFIPKEGIRKANEKLHAALFSHQETLEELFIEETATFTYHALSLSLDLGGIHSGKKSSNEQMCKINLGNIR